MRWLWPSLVVVWASVLAMPGARAAEVDLNLVLAVDVSGSIELDEAELQRKGFAEAFRDPRVIRAIQGGKTRRIAVTYVEWAGSHYTRLGVDWRVIDSPETSNAFADDLQILAFNSARWTSISGAIEYGVQRLRESPHRAPREVIDISGDGANNNGEYVTNARDRAVKKGITINGLPIVNARPSPYGTPQLPNLDWYFEDCVIGGPDAFIVVANGFEDFARAIRRKLIREIADPGGSRWETSVLLPAASPHRPPCDAGEKIIKDLIDDT
ncbi:MAG: DUF1194 domain-containing protein [Rhodospirillaceae bacterium]